MSHPFGDLLKQYRARKHGLSQVRLAQLVGYHHAVLARMSHGKKDLIGPSGRDRVVRILFGLLDEGVILTPAEANALLAAAEQPPLYEGLPMERDLLQRLQLAVAPELSVPAAPARFTPPAPLTALVGREREMQEIERLVDQARLVTLTGAGGSGKTRLAIEAAGRLGQCFTHGAAFVGLAPVRQAENVVPAIAQALGVRENPGVPLLETLQHFLAGKSLLLALDNYEHVLDAATVVTDLLATAPGVKVIATSREPLHLSGEHIVLVEPLELQAALDLFTQRARAARHTFSLRGAEQLVADICKRVDCLPLAIELAAARMRQYTPAALLALIREPGSMGLEVLTGGPRDLPSRQQTLRATIGWSYGLLEAEEQRLLRLLGVFAGGAQTEQIAGMVTGVDAKSLISSLQSLADKNLVRTEVLPNGATRYGLLELIREFALERLRECAELEAAQRRHAETYAALAESSLQPIRGHAQLQWRDRLQLDYLNLRAALAWSFGSDGDEWIGCRIVGALWYFWFIATQYLSEMAGWIRRARSASAQRVPPKARADVILCAMENDFMVSFADCIELGREMLALYQQAGDPEGIARAKFYIAKGLLGLKPNDAEGSQLTNESRALGLEIGDSWSATMCQVMLGLRAQWLGDYATAEQLLREMVAVRRGNGDLVALGIGLWQLTGTLMCALQFSEALACAKESAAVSRQVGNPLDEVVARNLIGENMRYLGDAVGAARALEESLAYAREQLPEPHIVGTLMALANADNEIGDVARAWELLAEVVRISRALSWPDQYYGDVLDCLATAVGFSGDALLAAQLWGTADVVWESNASPRTPFHTLAFASYRTRLKHQLGKAAFETATAAGRALPVQQAIDMALAGISPTYVWQAPASASSVLATAG